MSGVTIIMNTFLKTLIAFTLLLSTSRSFSQDTYKLTYQFGEGNMIDLAVGDNCYKLNSLFDFLIKANNDSNHYRYFSKEDSSVVLKLAPDSCREFNLFKQDDRQSYFKIDTIYHDGDTLISDLHCKKLDLNYITSFENEQKEILPHDTIQITLYISPQIKTITPFTYRSPKLNGLIIKYIEVHPEYSVSTGKLEKTYVKNEIEALAQKVNNLNDTFFKIPRPLVYVNEKEYYELLGISTPFFPEQ